MPSKSNRIIVTVIGADTVGIIAKVSAVLAEANANIVDISHLAWLHGYTFPAYGAKRVSYHWDRKPYGADNVMVIEGIDDTHTSCFGFPTVNRFAGVPVNGSNEIVRSMISSFVNVRRVMPSALDSSRMSFSMTGSGCGTRLPGSYL